MFKKISLIAAGLCMALLLAGFTAASLPPRPEPVEVVPAPNGERIQLHLENEVDDIPTDLWTVIEWQDTTSGDWYVVEGWQGSLDTSTTQSWWVGEDMFGDGPFRWRLYENINGRLLATSESFDLPAHAGLMVVVNVTLK